MATSKVRESVRAGRMLAASLMLLAAIAAVVALQA
jgi:hypothetical protein